MEDAGAVAADRPEAPDGGKAGGGAMVASASEVVKAAATSAAATAAAAADRAQASLQAAAAAADSHMPEGLRGALEDLCSRTKAVADSAAGAADSGSRSVAGELGGGLARLGRLAPLPTGFSMEEALAGLKVGLGGGDVATVRQVAGRGSGLTALLECLEHELAAARDQRHDAENAAALLEDETLCLM